MGPTASGKTDLAIAVAEALDGELISVDSALVYRGLDIGSAKPNYPHHLVDICDPSIPYSAAQFADDARVAIEDIRQRQRRPILVGGTMLYYRALLLGFAAMPEADPELRQTLEARALREGWPALHRELQAVDPVSAAAIHPNHSQRLLRALEVYRLTGTPISELHAKTTVPGTEDAVCVAIAPADRAQLHRRIETRFNAMMEAGFVEEVAALRGREDLHGDLPALRAVGYRQLWSHLDGAYDREEAVRRGIAATRQLAKRQFTWLRKWPDLHWILTDEAGRALSSLDLEDLSLAANQSLLPGSALHSDPADVLLNFLQVNPM